MKRGTGYMSEIINAAEQPIDKRISMPSGAEQLGKTSRKWLLIGLSAAAIIIIGLVSFNLTTYNELQKAKAEQVELSGKLDVLKEATTKLGTIIEETVLPTSGQAKAAYNESTLTLFDRNVEGSLVTDEITIERLRTSMRDGKVNMRMDIGTQPTMALKYKGQGKFDLSDRELKVMVTGLLDQVSQEYGALAKARADVKLPAWDSVTVGVTIKNYEIGTLSGGAFKLKGE
jgi:hypothetical protein